MKVVITGALGHIGSYLLRELPKAINNVEIILIDNLLTQRYCSLFNLPKDGAYKFYELDIRKAKLLPLFEDVDIVIHLAAITNAAGSFDNANETEENNYNCTKIVAEACAATETKMISLSSTSVYGTQAETVDENCSLEELKPQSPYAECKLKEEELLHQMGVEAKLDYVICRFGTICGISSGMRFHTAVNKFCWQAVMGIPITVWKTALHQKRPYLTLEDALGAFVFIINNNLFNRSIYNVLTDNLTVNEIVEGIKEHVPNLGVEMVDSEIMNQLSYEVLNTRFQKEGYECRGNIRESIADTIKLLGGVTNRHD